MNPRPDSCRSCPAFDTGRGFVPGQGPPGATIALLGQGPGEVEAALDQPFVGPSGIMLDRWLAAASLPRASVWVDNIVRCHLPENRPPKAAEVEHCRRVHWLPALQNHPALKVVVPVGIHAARALLGRKVTESVVGSAQRIEMEETK